MLKFRGGVNLWSVDKPRLFMQQFKVPSTQYSYTCPELILKVLLFQSQVPNYWVHGPSGTMGKGSGEFGIFIHGEAQLEANACSSGF